MCGMLWMEHGTMVIETQEEEGRKERNEFDKLS